MKTAILVLSIIGTVLAFAVGACSGACMSGLGEMAGDSSSIDMGTNLVLWAILESILGLTGGIMAFRQFGEDKKGGIALLVAAAISIHNTMQFLTSGVLFAIAGILSLVASKKKKLDSNKVESTQNTGETNEASDGDNQE